MTTVAPRAGEAVEGDVVAREQYVVDAGHIAQFADAVGDPHPLWRDPAYAAAHGYRGVPAPPTFGEALNPLQGMRTALTPPGQPGDLPGLYPVDPGLPHDFSAANTYVVEHPMIAGDVVDVQVRVARVRETTRGSGGRIVFVDYERTITRSDGLRLGSVTWTHGHFEDGDAGAGAPASRGEAVEELAVAELSTTRVGLAKWARVCNDYHPIHFDRGYAAELGFDDVFADGGRTSALLGRALADWLGPLGRVRSLSVRYQGFVHPGTTIRAAVLAGGASDAVPVQVVDDTGRLVAQGRASVRRPSAHEENPA